MKTYNVIDKNSDLVCIVGAGSEEEAIKLVPILVKQNRFYAEEIEQ